MEVYALVGASGTGKSHHAMMVAYENDIDTVIDDGLLIKEGQRLAGSSAKREATAVGAVKRAIFIEESQKEAVKAAIKAENPERLLILGTSQKMVNLISEALGLPLPKTYFFIEDISTADEIARAKEMRKTHGMHVIPVPVVEVKEDFQGYLMRPLRYFLRLQSGHRRGEKTIIQPKFSSVGKLVITDHALDRIITLITEEVAGVAKVLKVQAVVTKGEAAIKLEYTALLTRSIAEAVLEIRQQLKERVSYICGINVVTVDILVRDCIRLDKREINK